MKVKRGHIPSLILFVAYSPSPFAPMTLTVASQLAPCIQTSRKIAVDEVGIGNFILQTDCLFKTARIQSYFQRIP